MLKFHNPMHYFFIKDFRQQFRFFSSDPGKDIPIRVSRSKEIWELAQKKLLLLPSRTLMQEQAFISVLKIKESEITIRHSGRRPEKRLRLRFALFLHKQRSKHILLLVGETLLLPLSGLVGLLPGPNVAFAALALLMITHWRALRGINELARKKHTFLAAPLFSKWEDAAALPQENRFPQILEEIEKEYGLSQLRKILWK